MNDISKYFASGYTVISNLLLKNFHNIGISNDEFLVYIQLLSLSYSHKTSVSVNDVSKRLNLSDSNVIDIILRLKNRNFIKIILTNDKRLIYKIEDLYGVINQLFIFLEKNKEKNKKVTSNVCCRNKIIKSIEYKFGRPLSSREIEIIFEWFDKDKYSSELIELAIQEAIINNVFSINYIDRILFNWKQRNINNKFDVQKEHEHWKQKHNI